MDTKRSNKDIPEVIPPRICITFRRLSFWFRPKHSEIVFWEIQAENTLNTGPESRRHFSEKFKNHEHWSKLDPYSTSRAENQAFWISKVLPIQWDPSRPPKRPHKIQNRSKIQQTSPAKVYTNWFRLPWLYSLNAPHFGVFQATLQFRLKRDACANCPGCH